MAIYKIPNEGNIRQLNSGDVFGELWSTWNIDLHTDPGKIKLARPFKRVASSADVGNLDVVAFATLGTKAYALTSSVLYGDTAPFTSWTSESSTPEDAEDMVVFKGQLAITTGNNLDAYDGTTYTSDWWTARGNPALGSNPHILEVIRIGSETLAVTDGSSVHAYMGGITADPVTSVTVDLDAAMTAICLKSAVRRVWIGTYTEDGDQAYVYEWDGGSTNYIQGYPVGAKAVLAMELVDDVPVIVTERGEIKRFTGSGFTTIAQFPFATKPIFSAGVQTGQISALNASRPVHPKGMKRQGNTMFIYAAFNTIGDSQIPADERSPNGVWALDLSSNSLTHLGSPEGEAVFAASCPIMVVNDNNGRIFTGGKTYPAATADNGIWLEDLDNDSESYGYIVTSEIQSGSVSDTFDGAYMKALLGEDDSIITKYRTSRDTSLPVTVKDVAWVSTTIFNSTSSSLAAVKTHYDAGHRDEVEVLTGSGSGRLAQITKVEKSASTYSITVDETIGTAGELSTVRFDNWKKIPVTMTAADGELKKLGTAGENSAWAQFKIELRGQAGNPTIRELIFPTKTKESS